MPVVLCRSYRVHLVAAEHGEFTPRQRHAIGARRGLDPQRVLAGKVSDRIGWIPAVAGIGDVVEPHFVVFAVVEEQRLGIARIERGERLSLVSEGSEQPGENSQHSRSCDVYRIQPARCRPLLDFSLAWRFAYTRHDCWLLDTFPNTTLAVTFGTTS